MSRSWWTTLFGIVAIMLTLGLAGPASGLPPDKDPDNPAITSGGLTLTASIKIDPFCNATPGTVLSQTPVGGTQVSPGSLVRISITDWPNTCP
ncbi:PASTA domain-containing protein [Nonomuraea sp. NPDC055795]